MLAQDVELRSKMGAEARKLVKNEYSLRRVVDKYEKVFESVIHK